MVLVPRPRARAQRCARDPRGSSPRAARRLRAAAARRRSAPPARSRRLLLLGHEARREQPLGEIGRAIVPVQLPLEPRAALGEYVDLARDQLVEIRALEPVQVASKRRTRGPGTRTCARPSSRSTSDTSWQGSGTRSRTRVVGCQQPRHLRHEQTLDPQPLPNRRCRQGTLPNTGARGR